MAVLDYQYNSTGTRDTVLNATACDLFPNRKDYCDALIYSKGISATLSLIGCVFTLFIIWLFRKYTEFSQRLILNLSAASLLLAVCYLLSELAPPPGPLCTVQAAWMSFTNWAILTWIVTIIINLFTQVKWGKSLQRYERWLLLVCWGIPVLFAGLPFTTGAYGRAGAWCWLRNEWEWRFGTWYIWAIASVIIIAAVLIYTSCTLNRNTRDNLAENMETGAMRRRELRNDALTLRIYPIVYFAVNIFSVIDRVQQTVAGVQDDTDYNFPLLLLQGLFGPFLGGAVAVAFALDRRTIQLLTPSSIRSALRKRFANKTVIREFGNIADVPTDLQQSKEYGGKCLPTT